MDSGEVQENGREWSASDDDETTGKLFCVVYKKLLYGVVAVKTHYPLLGSGGESQSVVGGRV